MVVFSSPSLPIPIDAAGEPLPGGVRRLYRIRLAFGLPAFAAVLAFSSG
jgi:uncharacterized membrane protein